MFLKFSFTILLKFNENFHENFFKSSHKYRQQSCSSQKFHKKCMLIFIHFFPKIVSKVSGKKITLEVPQFP